MKEICGLRGCEQELQMIGTYQGGVEPYCPCCRYGDGMLCSCEHVRNKDGIRWSEIEREARKRIAIEEEIQRIRGEV